MIVVDSSYALQWFLEEPESDRAYAILADPELAAPDILIVEVANVLGKKVRQTEIGLPQAQAALAFIRDNVTGLVPSATLVDRALGLSVRLNHPVYDCVFLACAERLGTLLATRDDKFIRRVSVGGFGHLLAAPP